MPLNITTETHTMLCWNQNNRMDPLMAYNTLLLQDTLWQVEDISCDRIFVEKMVELFNLCELPPERLYRIIEHLLP